MATPYRQPQTNPASPSACTCTSTGYLKFQYEVHSLRTVTLIYTQTYWLQCSREPVTDPLFLLPLHRSEHLKPPPTFFCPSSVILASEALASSPRNPRSICMVRQLFPWLFYQYTPCFTPAALSNLTLRNPSVFRLSVRPSAHLQPSLQLHEHRASVLSPRCNLSHRSNLFFCHIKIT